MDESTYLFAGVAGYVGRPDDVGAVGVFRRPVDSGEWAHVLADLEAFAVFVHPEQPKHRSCWHRGRCLVQRRSRPIVCARLLSRILSNLEVSSRTAVTVAGSMLARRQLAFISVRIVGAAGKCCRIRACQSIALDHSNRESCVWSSIRRGQTRFMRHWKSTA